VRRTCTSCGENRRGAAYPNSAADTCLVCRSRTFVEHVVDVELNPGHVLRVALKRDGATGRLVLQVARVEAQGGHIVVGGSVVAPAAIVPELIAALQELQQ
jgi:hypothetical protein